MQRVNKSGVFIHKGRAAVQDREFLSVHGRKLDLHRPMTRSFSRYLSRKHSDFSHCPAQERPHRAAREAGKPRRPITLKTPTTTETMCTPMMHMAPVVESSVVESSVVKNIAELQNKEEPKVRSVETDELYFPGPNPHFDRSLFPPGVRIQRVNLDGSPMDECPPAIKTMPDQQFPLT